MLERFYDAMIEHTMLDRGGAQIYVRQITITCHGAAISYLNRHGEYLTMDMNKLAQYLGWSDSEDEND